MGTQRIRAHVKLVTGFIFNDATALQKAVFLLQRTFGPVDYESPILAFTSTDYYEKEFGTDLKKQFVSFKRLISLEKLPSIKIITNSIEKKLSKDHKRTVNIDPGYLDMAKFVLATTKDYVHRIYLGKGIFAEMTLYYRDKTFNPWDWTYPDFRTPEYIRVLCDIRKLYKDQLELSGML